MKHVLPVSFTVVAMFTLILAGCNSNSKDTPSANGPAATGGHDHEDHAKHGEAGMTDMEKLKVELAKLSPEDAASAEKQHICPVSGEMLGTMGAPEKVDVNGQQVWICCAGCKDSLLESPEKYLAKLQNE